MSDGGPDLMRGTVIVVLLVVGLIAVPWGSAAAGIGGVTDAITTATDTPVDQTDTPPEDTPTPPEDTPTSSDDSPTPPDDSPTPPQSSPTPPSDTPTPSGDTPTPASTPTPLGGSSGSATVTDLTCIEACSGVDMGSIDAKAVFLATNGISNVNVRLLAGISPDLSVAGVTQDTRFRAKVSIESDAGFTPQTLVVIGSQPKFVSTTSGTTASATVEFGVTSGAISSKVRVREPSKWPDRQVTATRQVDAIAIVNIAEVAGSSREDVANLQGVTIATNAQVFAPPTYQPAENGNPPKIQISVAAPHFLPDGTTQNTGQFTARLPDSLLDSWGVTDPEQLTASVSTGGGTLEIVEVADGIVVKLRNYHYSSGTITVQKAESAQTESTATDAATETATVTATPTAAPTATTSPTATPLTTPSTTATETLSPTATVTPTPTVTGGTATTTTTATTATPTATTDSSDQSSDTTAGQSSTPTTATSQTTGGESGAEPSADQTTASSPGFGAVTALLAALALLAGVVGRRRSR